MDSAYECEIQRNRKDKSPYHQSSSAAKDFPSLEFDSIHVYLIYMYIHMRNASRKMQVAKCKMQNAYIQSIIHQISTY